MKILNINCRSVVNKTTQLESLLLAQDAEIAVLTETWLSSDIYDSEFVPNDYKVFRKDRDRKGGGVAVLFKSSVKLFKMPDVPDIESIFCKVYIDKVRYVLGVMYRPPNSALAVLNNLRAYLQLHVKQEDRLILAGDFNLPNINWASFAPSSNNAIENEMLDIVFTFDLLQVVNNFTRIQENSKSILDLFFVSGTITNDITCDVLSGISDHEAVLLSLNDLRFSTCNNTQFYPNFSRADDASIIDSLAFQFDEFKANDCNVNSMWLLFRDIVFECIQHFVPTIAKKTQCRNPWITRDTLRLQRKLKRLKNGSKNSNCIRSKYIIESVTQELRSKTAHDKEKYYSTVLPSLIRTSPEKFWRQISPSSRSPSVFSVDGVDVCNDGAICAAFNNHFKSVFTKDNGHLPQFHMSLPSIPDLVISEAGVCNLLLNLDVKKSPGPDDIPNAFLKRYAEWCSKYLCVLYNRSLSESSLPDDWRTARIKPLHKSGDKTCVLNYRPISLTSTSCKILEHIIHKHLINFLEEHNVLSKVQHGFRHGFSTTTQLVETIHDFSKSINDRKQTDAIFMDFSKAFDKVSHHKLLHKLGYIINNTKLLAWISAFLRDRRQFVTLNRTSSDIVPVDSGVPQGSVLGPLLFLLFINDIVDNISVHVKLYADDCVLYNTINTIQDQIILNNDFSKVITWCEQWQMTVNFEKTVFMRITHKKCPLLFSYSTNNITLSEVMHYKYLGLWITNNLSWTKHIDTVTASALRKLFFLRRSLKSATPNVRSLAYNSIIRPALEYAVIIWDPFTATSINKLERIQRKAARFIFNKHGRASVSELLRQCDFSSISERNRICRLKFFFQLLTGRYGINTSGIFTFSTGYQTRQRHDRTILPLTSRNNCFKYSYFPRTIVDWNNLTNDAVTQNTLSAFEQHLK